MLMLVYYYVTRNATQVSEFHMLFISLEHLGPWADFSNDHVFRHPARGYGNNTYSGRNHTCRIIDEAGDRSFIQDRRSHISCSIGKNYSYNNPCLF